MSKGAFLPERSFVMAALPWLKATGALGGLSVAVVAGALAVRAAPSPSFEEERGAELVIEFAPMITQAESRPQLAAAEQAQPDQQAKPELEQVKSQKTDIDLPTEQASPSEAEDPDLRMAKERTREEAEVAPEMTQATEVACDLGTEIAHWLSSHTKITGSFHSAARFKDSWNEPWLAAPSPKKATATQSWPSFLAASAAPQAIGMLAPMMPLQLNLCALSNRCMWPPLPLPRPVTLPNISAVMGLSGTPLAMAKWCGRCVPTTVSSSLRWAQMPTATGSWPAARCISPGTGPEPMSKARPFWMAGGSLPSM